MRSYEIATLLTQYIMSTAEIYYFKPQTVLVSTMFLAIISYVLGVAMETFIPRTGWFQYLNPVYFFFLYEVRALLIPWISVSF